MELLNSDAPKALLENDVDDGRKYSSIESKTIHTSLHVVSSGSPKGIIKSTKGSLNSDTGKATISEEILNLIKLKKRKTGELSSGQKNRVSLAKAFINEGGAASSTKWNPVSPVCSMSCSILSTNSVAAMGSYSFI